MLAVVAQILEAELGDGADARSGVGQGSDDGTVAEPHRPCTVDGRQELAHLRDGDLGSLPAPGVVSRAPDGEEGIEDDGVAHDEEVEEVAERRERQPLAGDGSGEGVEEAGRRARVDLSERQVVILAPLQEPADRTAVGSARMGVTEPGGEKFIRREASLRTRVAKNRRKERETPWGERGRIGRSLGHDEWGFSPPGGEHAVGGREGGRPGLRARAVTGAGSERSGLARPLLRAAPALTEAAQRCGTPI